MTGVYTKTSIRRSAEQVYNYVTTPGNWPKWHPSSLKVAGTTDHSLELSEQVTEDFLVARRRGGVVWAVRERQATRSQFRVEYARGRYRHFPEKFSSRGEIVDGWVRQLERLVRPCARFYVVMR